MVEAGEETVQCLTTKVRTSLHLTLLGNQSSGSSWVPSKPGEVLSSRNFQEDWLHKSPVSQVR